MAFETEFLEFMQETITIETFLYQNAEKVKVYGPARSYRARISGKGISLRRSEKEELASIVDVWLYAGNDAISVNDRLTLPDNGAWTDRTPVIFAVARYTDTDGQHNAKIQCGWMYHRQGQ